MKYSASLKFRTIDGKGEYRWRRDGRSGISGRLEEAKKGRYKRSAKLPRRRLLLYRKARKY